MKRILIFSIVGIVLLYISFVAGRMYQDGINGYHTRVIEQKQYESAMGPVEWNSVEEQIGLPSGGIERTMIQFQGRTIYKAQRDFQESVPFAQNVTVSNNVVDWDDGELRFHLVIDEVKKGYRRLGNQWVKHD